VTKPGFAPGALKLLSDGQFQFTVPGLTGTEYEILVSTDLQNWRQLATVELTNATGVFIDTNRGLPKSFYRVRPAP